MPIDLDPGEAALGIMSLQQAQVTVWHPLLLY